MKSKRKIIGSILTSFMILVLAIATVSQAVAYNSINEIFTAGKDAVGGTIQVGKTSGKIQQQGINRSENLYCIQRGEDLEEAKIYTIDHYIEIEGNKAVIYNKDGTKIDYNPGNDSSNAMLAYIIGGNGLNGKYIDYEAYVDGNTGGKSGADGKSGYGLDDDHISVRQLAMWEYWNEWAENAQKALGSDKYNWSNNTNFVSSRHDLLMNDAKSYSMQKSSIAYIRVTNSADKTIKAEGSYDECELIGPIALNFGGTLSKIIGKASDNSEVKDFEYYDKNKNKLNGLQDIKSNQEFYIKSKKSVETINFSVKAEGTIKARIWIIESSGTTQRLILTDSEKTNTNADVTIKVNRQEEGNIQIHKQDASKKTALQGAEFKIFIGTKNEGNHWLSVDKLGAYVYTSSYENAKVFTSNSDGNVTINNLRAGYKVSIYETKAPNGYDLKSQKGYDQNNNRVWCNEKYYTVTASTQEDGVELNKVTIGNSKTGDLEIIKQDSETKEKLAGAEFRISVKAEGNKSQNIWLKQNNDGTYNYEASYNDATKFTTDSDGTALIKDLDPQKYFIYETKAPSGYDLKLQENYNSQNGWVVCGAKEVSSGKKVEVPVDNAKLIAIEGYVWVDKPLSKSNTYNNIIDEEEDYITENVNIRLRSKSDKTVVAENPKIVTEKIYKGTKNEREVKCYRFEGVKYNNLKDYYVEFDYGKNYGGHIVVKSNFELAEGSKAMSTYVPQNDSDLNTVATTYIGSKNEQTYGLSGLATKFFNKDTNTLENINLGITPIIDPDFAMSEVLAYVDLEIKGYKYTYYAGQKGEKLVSAPSVELQIKNEPESYTREIYPADISYRNEDVTKELHAYVTYRVDVYNNEQTDIQYLYQEQYLNVKEIKNSFDADRYELADNNWSIESEKDGYINVKMNENGLKLINGEKGIKNSTEINKNTGLPNNYRYAYIRLKIKDEKLKELLAMGENKTAREKVATYATVKANHEYTRMDSSWENNLERTQTHYTNVKDKTDKAAFLDLRLGQNRTISGKVFEDSKDTSRPNELVGNGIDDNENKVQGVKVELGNYINNQFNVSNLYQVAENGWIVVYDQNGNIIQVNSQNEAEIIEKMKKGEYGDIWNKAETTTKSDGTYSFEGVVPGEYFIRFTYGDGTQKIYDAEGRNVVKENVYSDEYKSTIVTSEVKTAFETYENKTSSYDQKIGTGTATWYIDLENHNTAVDNLDQRKDLSQNKYEVTIDNLGNKNSENITAQTPLITIPIEYTTETIGDPDATYKNEINNINFGIIETPKTRLDIKKKITNVTITLQNNQVLISGNPAKQDLPYTTDYYKGTDKEGTYVKVEVDLGLVHGGKLEIEYEIEVINNSDLDYTNDNGAYYKYGTVIAGAKEKTVEVKQIYDYLDPKLTYVSKNGTANVELKDIEEFRNNDDNTLSDEQKLALKLVKTVEEETSLTFKNILEINGIQELYSSKGANKNQSSDKVLINAKHELSSNEDDLEFINIAEVVRIKTQPILPANVEFPASAKTIAKTPKVVFTITPPTGGNRNMTYIILGTVTLIIVAGGIFVMRKKILK